MKGFYTEGKISGGKTLLATAVNYGGKANKIRVSAVTYNKETGEMTGIKTESVSVLPRHFYYFSEKIKADNYCRFGYYEKAIEEYTNILRTDDMLNATEEDYGTIYHNMGTAFCGIGSFIKASDSFEHAYEKNRNEE